MDADVGITFRPVQDRDLSVLARWLSEPHVRPWFYEVEVDESFLLRELAPVLASSTSKRGYVIAAADQEIGYAETYLADDHEKFFQNLKVPLPGTAGCDVFIGAPEWTGRGVGTHIIRTFTADLILSDGAVRQVIAAPDVRNQGSQRAFKRAGYRRMYEVQVPGDAAPAVVMGADRSSVLAV